MSLVEDLSVFFADFNTTATLDGAAVDVIFDNAYADPLGVATRQPQAMLTTASAAAATQASVLVVGGVTYRVRSMEPDGTGVTTLTLERQ
jgi:hypothetical protein